MTRDELIEYTIWIVKEIKHGDTPRYLVDRYLAERGENERKRDCDTCIHQTFEPKLTDYCYDCLTNHLFDPQKKYSNWQPK